MSTRLVILGILKNKPLHGYEIKHIIEKHMGDWTNIAFGSIYFALNMLNKEGYVEQDTVKKVGNRPSRSIYRITEKGKNEYMSLLRKTWETIERNYYPIDIALTFSHDLPENEVKDYIKKRIEYLEQTKNHIKEHKKEQIIKKNVPKSAEFVFTHTEFHLEAEYKWLNSLLDNYSQL
jgi:DNA-binding PadR family transcriptional regulator